jgi:hypothetical protein
MRPYDKNFTIYMVNCIQFMKCHPVLGSCHMICFHPYGVWGEYGVNILDTD